MINLALAFIWGLLGVALIAYHATTGDERWRIWFLGNISAGWAMLLICVYNVARWWSMRTLLAAKRAEIIARARREREHHAGPRPEYGEPNPEFMFGDEPPPPKT